ncbi:amino acid permease [Paenibacillus soyae]|uniref:Amino acid permease n=1 Tax=Paenibacillus soyae TaxID=2969249 RepID=A0A9X2S847_9BACL|nr:amino acid permease [Paenibacillus soyae]MCR2803840.1 amino acid permease [Paenibacillus soyae]
MKWWHLSLLGVACTIGTGYFLGTSVGIRIGGPALTFGFLLAAAGAFVVFDVLARMTANDPKEGSFCAYAGEAFGRWARFGSGWVYLASELLIMGSQMTALSLFTRFWFPNVPMWIFASIYGVLGLGVIWIGTKGFERTEHILAAIKLSAIVVFIALAVCALFGLFGKAETAPSWPKAFFPAGPLGAWSSLIFAFYSFGGIEIMGLMAIRLKDPKEAPKAGRLMISTLTALYVASMLLVFTLVPWDSIKSQKSPFIESLKGYGLAFVPHLFHGVFIVAGFSTMVASLFAVITILTTLAKNKDAPPVLAKTGKGKKKQPYFAIAVTAGAMVVSVVLALLMPDELYEYITTAAGLMLLYNWTFILFTSGKLLDLSAWGQTKRWTGVVIILLAVSGTSLHHTSRPGFFISMGFVVLIGVVTIFMKRVWKKKGTDTVETG